MIMFMFPDIEEVTKIKLSIIHLIFICGILRSFGLILKFT